jgi:anti-anti-sigma regulatory factor
MFFAATDKLLEIDSSESGISVIILRASNMTLLDIEAIRNLEKMVEECKKNGVTVIVSHIKDQPLRAMQKVGLLEKIGEGNFVSNIDEAIHLAEKILEEERSCKEAAAEEERLRRAALAEEKKKRADELAAIKRKKAMERSTKAVKMIADNLTEGNATTDADIAENVNAAADSAEWAENAEKI